MRDGWSCRRTEYTLRGLSGPAQGARIMRASWGGPRGSRLGPGSEYDLSPEAVGRVGGDGCECRRTRMRGGWSGVLSLSLMGCSLVRVDPAIEAEYSAVRADGRGDRPNVRSSRPTAGPGGLPVDGRPHLRARRHAVASALWFRRLHLLAGWWRGPPTEADGDVPAMQPIGFGRYPMACTDDAGAAPECRP